MMWTRWTHAANNVRAVWPMFAIHLLIVGIAEIVWQNYFPGPRTGTAAVYGPLIAGMAHWDGGWYLKIAEQGYIPSDPNRTAFFPLYPTTVGLLTRIVGALAHLSFSQPVSARTYLLVGIVVSNLCFLAALTLLWRVARVHLSPQQARRGLWLLALFPTSYYFSAVYTEAMFLMFVAAAFYFAYSRRWWLAAAAAGLAALTRNLGIFCVLSLLWLVWKDFKEHRDVPRAIRRAAVVTLLPGACLALYPAWLWHVYGNPLMFEFAEAHHWNRHFSWVWNSLWLAYRNDPLTMWGGICFLILVVLAFRRLAFEQWLYSAVALLIPLSSVSLNSPVSLIRYVVVLFPVFLYLGHSIRRSETFTGVLTFFTVFMVVFTGLFATGRWVA